MYNYRVRSQKKRDVVGLCNKGASGDWVSKGKDARAEISSSAPQTYCDYELPGNLVRMQIPILNLGSEEGTEVLHV